MKLQICSIFDSKAQVFHAPLFFANVSVAQRAFSVAVNEPTSFLYQSPSDYSLMLIGEWDDETAAITTHAAPENLGLAATFKKETDK